MRIDERTPATFDEELLRALQQRIVRRQQDPSQLPDPSSSLWRRRLVVSIPVVVALSVAIAVLGLGSSTPSALAISRAADGTVSVTVKSFQDPTALEQGLAAAGIKSMIQLLPNGRDCSAPQAFNAAPMNGFPAAFNAATNPQANPPIDTGGTTGAPLTLILRYIPSGATLVIQSMRSPGLVPDNPKNTYMLAISGPGRGMRVFWATGQVSPCAVVATASAR